MAGIPAFNHPHAEDAVDQVDAMVFVGDTLVDPDDRDTFRIYLERWGREVERMEEIFPREEDDDTQDT